jgi:hypothetical protein
VLAGMLLWAEWGLTRERAVGYVCGRREQPSDQPHMMGTAVRTAKTSPASWDAFTDMDAVVDEVLTELAALAADGTRPARLIPN